MLLTCSSPDAVLAAEMCPHDTLHGVIMSDANAQAAAADIMCRRRRPLSTAKATDAAADAADGSPAAKKATPRKRAKTSR